MYSRTDAPTACTVKSGQATRIFLKAGSFRSITSKISHVGSSRKGLRLDMQRSEKEKLVEKLRRAADAQRRAFPGNLYHNGIAPEVKCLSCGHRIAERPFEVYCNIMCKWVNEKDYCTMFEPGHMGHKCQRGEENG